MVRLTEPEGSVVRPNLAEPPSSADTDADADSSVVHYFSLKNPKSKLPIEVLNSIFSAKSAKPVFGRLKAAKVVELA